MMTEAATVFDNIVKQRRSMRVYDANKPFDGEAVHRSLQRAMYAPNSSNMQMWEFYRVTDPEKIKQLAKYAMNQSAARTARELVLFVVPKAKWKQRAKANFEFHHARYGNKPLHELSKREQRKLKYFTRLMPMYYFQDWLGIWGMVRKLIVTISSLWRGNKK